MSVVPFNGVSSLNSSPETMLDEAKVDCESAVVIGYDKDGEFYFKSSLADGGDVLWLMELAKKKLLEIEA